MGFDLKAASENNESDSTAYISATEATLSRELLRARGGLVAARIWDYHGMQDRLERTSSFLNRAATERPHAQQALQQCAWNCSVLNRRARVIGDSQCWRRSEETNYDNASAR